MRKLDHRNGFTLLELVVSIAIIGVLIALLLPAVARGRSLVVRLQCQTRLRNIAIAMHEFAEVEGHLPAGKEFYGQYAVDLLPYIGQQAVYDILVAEGSYPPPEKELSSASVKSWNCPADDLATPNRGHQNYLFNAGLGLEIEPSGIVRPLGSRVLALEDVTDGASNTALASERLIDLHQISTIPSSIPARNSGELRTIWFSSRSFPPDPRHVADFERDCTTVLASDVPAYRVGRLTFWGDAVGYTHTFPPNQPACFNGAVVSSVWDVSPHHWDYSSRPATSTHTGGVNLARCDASVTFVSENIDRQVWHTLGTISAGDTR